MRAFRKATLADLPEICDLVLDLERKVGKLYGMPMDGPSVVATVSRVIKHGFCRIGHGGVAAGMVAPCIFNLRWNLGVVLFWNFVKPSGAFALDSLIEDFRRAGVRHITVSSHYPLNRMSGFYEKRGFRPIERQYILALPSLGQGGKENA